MDLNSRFSGPFVAILLALLLTACGTRQADVSTVGDSDYPALPTASAKTPQKKAERPMIPAQQGGGYYKSDGPHAMVPADLDHMADAVPRIDPIHPPSLRPYRVMGQNFVPRTSLDEPYKARGHASWYGRKFHGNTTAIGEIYDMYEMTAAHPTLPLPSYVRVTNTANGHSVIVRVNDRGPFLRGRLIDLSYAAAHRLGFINAGSAIVDVELLTHETIAAMNADPAPRPDSLAATQAARGVGLNVEPLPLNELASAPPPSSPIPTSPLPSNAATYLQLGAFSTQANAARLMERVQSELQVLAEQLHLFNDAGRYRLQIGPFASEAEARSTAGRITMLLDVQPYVVLR